MMCAEAVCDLTTVLAVDLAWLDLAARVHSA